MRIYSNNRRGENTLDRMKITIRVPGNEKFGIITHFERPSVHNAPYTYDHEFSEAQIDFEDSFEIEMMIRALQKLQEAVVTNVGKFVIEEKSYKNTLKVRKNNGW